MDIALLIARLVLAVVFTTAGLAKLVDRAGSQKAVVDFGLPAITAGPLAILLPLAELAVAVALIPRATAWVGAVGALALLLLFMAGIVINMARGRKPDCHCFGQLHSAPIGWRTVVRNGVLAATASLVVWQGINDPGLSVTDWLAPLNTWQLMALAAGLLLLSLVAAQAWLLVHVMVQNGRLLTRIDALEGKVSSIADLAQGASPDQPVHAPVPAPKAPGLPVGSEAPAFSLPGLYGETLTLDALRAQGKPVVLVFSDPGCDPCTALMPELGHWQQYAGQLTVALLSRGSVEENRTKCKQHGISNVLLQEDREIANSYQAYGTPTAVIVSADGAIATPMASGADGIRKLIEDALSGSATIAPAAAPHPLPKNVPTVGHGNGHGNSHDAAHAVGSLATVYSVDQTSFGSQHVIPAAPSSAAPKASGLQTGELAPQFRLPDLTGKLAGLGDFLGSDTVVIFWNPTCGFCQRITADLKSLESNPTNGLPRLLFVSTGTVAENQALRFRSTVVLEPAFATGRLFGATGTPSAVRVDKDGRIASDVAVGGPAMLALAGGAHGPMLVPADGRRDAADAACDPVRSVPKLGELAPSLRLPNLAGKMVDLKDFKGNKTLVVFWNPGCGFCSQMLDDWRAFEEKPPRNAPRLLFVAGGSVEENRAMGLRSTVVIDDGFRVSSSFGAGGTPMAILLDARGRVASDLAQGAPAVMALAGVRLAQRQPSTA